MVQIQNKKEHDLVTNTFQTTPTKELRKQGRSAMTKRSTHSDGSMREDDSRNSQSVSRIPLWVSIVVILGALLIATGAVISKLAPTLLTNGEAMTGAARVYADYMFARNLPLAMMLFLLLATKARRMLAGLMVLTALIQIVDVINDLTRGDFLLVPGLLVFAIVFLIGASVLFGQAVWHVDAWRELGSHSPGSH
jgi:hypothetical protein